MKTKRIAFGFLILSLLACNYVTQMVFPPTVTPTPTLTATPSASPTPTLTPLVPAFIPPECPSVPLATVSPDVLLAQPTLEVQSNPEISKREQLRILRVVADIVEQVYVYPDFNGKDWNEIESRYRSRIEAGLDTEAFYLEMQKMITELGDEHSYYLSPLKVQQAEAELKGELDYMGVGIYGNYVFEKESFVVISTIAGSAAEYGGLRSHDSILLVDGLPITKDLGNRLRGPGCSVAILKVQSPGEAPRDVMLMRHRIEGNLPVEARLVPTTDGSRIGYILIPTFFDETIPPQVENALNEFGQLDGLILDIRLNGGGISTVIFPILEFFTDGRLGRFVSRESSRPLTIDANPIQNSQSVPLIVMVSEDTASFGEIFAGVLRDAGRARIVGQTSLGNVEVLNRHDFDDGSQLWIASETFDSAFSDMNWEQTGIVPDVQAFAEWDSFHFETDPSLAAALELLGHK
jgi:C-terminal peptidase prc